MNEQSEDYEKFLMEGGRGPRRSTRDMLIAQHLSIATFTTKKSTINHHICSACMQLKQKEVPDLDLELMKRIFMVNEALSRPGHKADIVGWNYGIGATYRHSYQIAWGFPLTEENYKKYIAPWEDQYLYWPQMINCPDPPKTPEWLYFLDGISQSLSDHGWRQLWRSFIAYAYPEVMKAKAVLSKFVTPQLLQEVTESYTGKHLDKEPKAT